MSGRQSPRRVAGALCIGLMFVAAGCGSSADDRGAGSKAAAPAADQAGGAQNAQSGNTPARAPVEVPPDQRSIIYTGTIAVEPDDVDAAADDAIAAARAAGGVVSGDNRSRTDDRATATVTLRVPSEKFNDVMTALSRLGRERNREVKTEDVTEQVVDVQSRIATAQASVDRVRALLAQATTLGEVVSLESEVARREADLESLKARLNKLTGLAAMSTVTAVFTRDGRVAETKRDDGFLAGFTGGWNSFTASMTVLLTVFGALLPWILMLGVPALAIVVLLRRAAAARGDRAQPVPADHGRPAGDEA